MGSPTKPILRECRSCGVAWDPRELACWMCGTVVDFVHQLGLANYGVSAVGYALEEELASKRRDWGGDPTAWRRLPERRYFRRPQQ